MAPGGVAPREFNPRPGDLHVLQLLFWDADRRHGWQRTYHGVTLHRLDENSRGVFELAQPQRWRARRMYSLPAATSTDGPILVDPEPVKLRYHAPGAGDGAPHFAMRKFSMGAGGGMPRHTNQVEHEQYVLAGRARVTVGDGAHEVAAGA